MSQAAIVIIGTGMAGYTVAREFRKLDKESPLCLISQDDASWYSKPNLSTALSNRKSANDLAMSDRDTMATQLQAEIRALSHVEAIKPESHEIIVDGETLRYGKLVLALGASPFVLPIKGEGARDVLHVNNLDDYRIFRDKLSEGATVAIIGAGLIGCEFANDLANAGHAVHVIDLADTPLRQLMPGDASQGLREALSDIGVHWHLGTSVSNIERDGQAYRLNLANGEQVQAALLLSAVGLRANTQLARDAGIEVKRGIVADTLLRTSAPDIYTLGDCAEVAGLLLPFVMPIMQAARALARTLAGEQTAVSYPVMPVVVKTPAHPVVAVPPPADAEGEWQVEQDGGGTRALFRDAEGKLLGFAVSGAYVSEKLVLSREISPPLA